MYSKLMANCVLSKGEAVVPPLVAFLRYCFLQLLLNLLSEIPIMIAQLAPSMLSL